MTDNHTAPEPNRDAFHCPHCEVYSHQRWYNRARLQSPAKGGSEVEYLDKTTGSVCERCKEFTIWIDGDMIYPSESAAPLPAEDTPDNVRRDFEEARQVVNDSPRAAAALLRLAIEKIVDELGADGDSLHARIGNLVAENRIDARIQKALDSVRVIGNESVHPGTMDMRDDRDTALELFNLINIIVRTTLTDDRLIEERFAALPEAKKDGIEQRDNGS